MTPPVVACELPPGGQRFPSQRPYKYGMVMLCLGALINWLGLAENYFEPVRYVGVACIVTGAMLIISAMCCWMNSNNPTPPTYDTTGIHVIDIPGQFTNLPNSKPPDYESITAPPSYDVAINLNPAHLLTNNTGSPGQAVDSVSTATLSGDSAGSTSSTSLPEERPPPSYDVASKSSTNDTKQTITESVPVHNVVLAARTPSPEGVPVVPMNVRYTFID